MPQLHSINPSVRYHKSTDGHVRPCNAKVKACPYSKHWDSKEEAETAPRVSFHDMLPEDPNPFQYHLTVDHVKPLDEKDYEAFNLRTMGERSRQLLAKEGRRTRAPKGVYSIDLGFGKRLVIERSPYMSTMGPAAFYELKYYQSSTEYEFTSMKLFSNNDYQALQNYLEHYYSRALESFPEHRGSHELYAKNLDKAYRKTIQAITETEILARGAQEAYEVLGADVFSKDDPDTLELDTNCNSSAFQAYDVVDALKAHAMTDDRIKKVKLHVYDEFPGGRGTWGLTREEDGSWFFSYDLNKRIFCKMITVDNAENVRKALGEVFEEAEVPASMRKSQVDFAAQMVAEVEPAVKNYEATVASRLGGRKARQAPGGSSPEGSTLKKRLLGLFG